MNLINKIMSYRFIFNFNYRFSKRDFKINVSGREADLFLKNNG